MAPTNKSLETRMAVAERTIAAHEREVELARERWHASQSDRQALHMVIETVRLLPERCSEMAKQAAADALVIYERDREKAEREKSGLSIDRLGIVVAIVIGAASIYFNAR